MKISVNTRDFEKLIDKNKALGEKVIERAYDYFLDITPVDTGNARNNTHLLKNNRTILADYPYAKRLDTGWSKQAKNGMSGPTLAKLDQWTDAELRKMKNG